MLISSWSSSSSSSITSTPPPPDALPLDARLMGAFALGLTPTSIASSDSVLLPLPLLLQLLLLSESFGLRALRAGGFRALPPFCLAASALRAAGTSA